MYLKKRMAAFIIFAMWFLICILKIMITSNSIIWGTWVAAGVLIFLIGKKIRLHLSKEQKIWIVFMIYTLFSTMLNYLLGTENNYDLLRLILNNTLLMFFPLLISVFLYSSIGCQNVFLTYFRNFTFVCGIVGVMEYATKVQWYKGLIRTENALNNFQVFSNLAKNTYRLSLIFYHPIYYAVLLILGIICCLYFPYKNRYFQIFTICLLIANLILTQARTGWLAGVICAVLFMLKHSKNKLSRKQFLQIVKGCAIVFCLLLVIVFSQSNILSGLKTIIYERVLQAVAGQATDVRFGNLQIVRDLASKKNLFFWIFGGGERFAISYLENHPTFYYGGQWTNAIDNQYLTTFLNYGIVGFGMICHFFITVMNHFFAISENVAFEGVYLGLVAIMIAALFFDPFGSNCIYYMMLILMSFTIPLKNSLKKID